MKRCFLSANHWARRWGLVHICLLAVALCGILGGAVFTLCVWRTIPSTVGYHFAGDGTFNLFGDKQIAFVHPFVAQILLWVLFGALGTASFFLRPLRGVNSTGNRILQLSVATLCDLYCLTWIVLFSHWVWCVCRQTPLYVPFARALIWVDIALSLAFVSVFSGVCIACRVPKRYVEQQK